MVPSSSVVPPGNCGIHGYHGRSACPNCSTSALPFPLLAQSPPPGPASVSPAEPPVLQFIDPPETTYERTGSAKRPDLMGELTALADAFYRVVEYLRTPTPTITESEAAEIADAALFRAEEVIDRGR